MRTNAGVVDDNPLSESQQELAERRAIERCQTGDKEAYGVLVKLYMKRAYFIALGIVGSHENALDLSQEAFVRAYRAIHRLDPKRRFFTWYYQILRNLCFNFLRDHARRARSFSEIGDTEISRVAATATDTATVVEQDELREAVWQAIAELEDQDREIIILKEFQELSYKEIADVLQCPIGTVMSRLYSARQALKSKLVRYLK